MSQFASALSILLGRTVDDRTNLAGQYDIDLSFTPEGATAAAPASEPGAPSLLTALQEQLGLKLESGKGHEEVLVFARVARPTEN
jgi:uncharacterized protein (TIGR03435 family)